MNIGSMPCRFEHFSSEWYEKWRKKLCYPVADKPAHAVRKWWEYAAIAEALDERGLLQSGKKGIGFAVGREPLASLFAARGASILATDLDADVTNPEWTSTGQHAAALEDIWAGEEICRRRDFDRLVCFQPMDMNHLPPGDRSFDFAWSSCAFEHLGSLEDGIAFVKRAMAFLRTGGIAVHTTEFNVCSNEETLLTGGAVIYRRRDIEMLERSLRSMRCGMEYPEFGCGTHQYDLLYDEEPFFTRGLPHVKLLQDGFVCTSFVMVITAG